MQHVRLFLAPTTGSNAFVSGRSRALRPGSLAGNLLTLKRPEGTRAREWSSLQVAPQPVGERGEELAAPNIAIPSQQPEPLQISAGVSI